MDALIGTCVFVENWGIEVSWLSYFRLLLKNDEIQQTVLVSITLYFNCRVETKNYFMLFISCVLLQKMSIKLKHDIWLRDSFLLSSKRTIENGTAYRLLNSLPIFIHSRHSLSIYNYVIIGNIGNILKKKHWFSLGIHWLLSCRIH